MSWVELLVFLALGSGAVAARMSLWRYRKGDIEQGRGRQHVIMTVPNAQRAALLLIAGIIAMWLVVWAYKAVAESPFRLECLVLVLCGCVGLGLFVVELCWVTIVLSGVGITRIAPLNGRRYL